MASLLLAGCVDSSPKHKLAWNESLARYEDDQGGTFSLELQTVRPILTHDNSWRAAMPLVIDVAPGDRRGQATLWLGAEGEVVRAEIPCTRLEGEDCAAARQEYQGLGEAPLHAVGLLERETIRVGAEEFAVKRHGRTVTVGPYVVPETGHQMATVTASFDTSPFPAWIRYEDAAGRIIKEVRRTAVEVGPPLARPDAVPPKPQYEPILDFRLFPGDGTDVLGRGYAPQDPFDALMDQSEDARRMFEGGCLVQLYVAPNPHAAHPYEELGVNEHASDFALIRLAALDGPSMRWNLGLYNDILHPPTWRVEAWEEMEPFECPTDDSGHRFVLDAQNAMERFDRLDLTYQSSPGFALRLFPDDSGAPLPARPWFEVSAIPAWVDRSQGLLGYQPHMVRIDPATGFFHIIQHDPVDSNRFTGDP